MTDKEDMAKSLRIARAMELYIEQDAKDDAWFIQVPAEWNLNVKWFQDFYDPCFMILAWRVLAWGLIVKPTDPVGSIHSPDRFHNKLKWWLRTLRWGNSDAQRQWLDKVYELITAEESE